MSGAPDEGWGELCAFDHRQIKIALRDGLRGFCSYDVPAERIWIITEAARAIEAFAGEFGAKWPKASAKIVEEKEQLLAFYEFPAEHWRHLRTTNPIESTFAPVRARTGLTKGPGSREAGVAMIYKLLEAAEGRWRRLNGSHLVALVSAGASFVNGELVERNEEKDAA
jgi:hypothetical protein